MQERRRGAQELAGVGVLRVGEQLCGRPFFDDLSAVHDGDPVRHVAHGLNVVRAQILNLLTDLKKELGLAMVFISHDIQTVRYVSDRIAVMNRGVVVEEGPAAQLLADPYEPYTRELLGAAPSLLHPNLDLEGEY